MITPFPRAPAPGWLARRLRAAVVILLVFGVGGFLVDGANRPANPYLLPPPTKQAPRFGTASLAVDPGPGLSAPRAIPCVLVASTEAARDTGMMGRRTVAPYAGMAFVFAEPTPALFYMKDTPLALSVAWFDAAGRYVGAATMPPCLHRVSCPTYGADQPFDLALEVPAGQLGRLGVGPGSVVHLTPGCD